MSSEVGPAIEKSSNRPKRVCGNADFLGFSAFTNYSGNSYWVAHALDNNETRVSKPRPFRKRKTFENHNNVLKPLKIHPVYKILQYVHFNKQSLIKSAL